MSKALPVDLFDLNEIGRATVDGVCYVAYDDTVYTDVVPADQFDEPIEPQDPSLDYSLWCAGTDAPCAETYRAVLYAIEGAPGYYSTGLHGHISVHAPVYDPCYNDTDTDAFEGIEGSDGWSVRDPSGGRWWPDYEASREIDASYDPEYTAIRICLCEPTRGRWVD